MSVGPNLGLTYGYSLGAGGWGDAVNANLQQLDGLVQGSVKDKDLATPPGSPTAGDRYIVATSPTGAWAGQATKIAAYQDGTWEFYAPKRGWTVYVDDERKHYRYVPSRWSVVDAIFNVETWGAVGDGSTDDSAAIQAAINAAVAASGGVVLFPRAATYVCASSLTISDDGVTLQGITGRNTILSYTGAGDFIVLGSDDGNHSSTNAYDGTTSFTHLKSIKITGPGVGGSTRAVVDWDSGANSFYDVEIASFNKGFFGVGADGNRWINCYIHGNSTGLHLAGRSDQTSIWSSNINENAIGILIENAHGTSIVGGQFVFNTTADIVLDNPATPTSGVDERGVTGLFVNGAWFESNTTPATPRHVWVGRNGTSARLSVGVSVRDCLWFASNSTAFMEVDAGTKIEIANIAHEGASSTLVVNNAVSGVNPIVHVVDDASILPSNVTIFSGQNATMWLSRGRGSTRSASFATPYTPVGNSQEIVELGALTSNLTVNAPSTPVRGFQLTFRIVQDATGGRTVTWDSVFKHSWSDTGNTANKRSTITFYYDGANWNQVGAQSPYI